MNIYISLFPAYPKSHINRYASVVELPTTVISSEGVTKLRNALQYSLRKGAGKQEKVVNFFKTEEEEEVKMNYHYRQCAGVKVCEFIPEEMKLPHTEADPVGHEWVNLSAIQE